MSDFNSSLERAVQLLKQAEVLTSRSFSEDVNLLIEASMGNIRLIPKGSKIYLAPSSKGAKLDECSYWMFSTPEKALDVMDAASQLSRLGVGASRSSRN